MFISFADLPVSDQSRAKAFYAEKMGCEVVVDAPMGPGGWRWIELRFPGAETSLHFVRRPDETPSTEPTLEFITSDLEGTVRGLSAKGVTIVHDVGPAPWNPAQQVAVIRDSEGNRIVIGSR